MASTSAELVADFYAEVGSDLDEMVKPERVLRWMNQGQARLPRKASMVEITWNVGDASVDMLADFIRFEGLIDVDGCLPAHRVWGNAIVFSAPAYDSGSATLLYWADWPAISNTQDSTLPQVGEQGLVSFALYRFFKTLASSRADFRRYATISQANGVDISELDALSERHLADYEDAQEEMNVQHAASFFGE